MRREQSIAEVLHATRVAALPGINPHGLLGLLRLAEIVSNLHQESQTSTTIHDTLSREPRSSASCHSASAQRCGSG